MNSKAYQLAQSAIADLKVQYICRLRKVEYMVYLMLN